MDAKVNTSHRMSVGFELELIDQGRMERRKLNLSGILGSCNTHSPDIGIKGGIPAIAWMGDTVISCSAS